MKYLPLITLPILFACNSRTPAPNHTSIPSDTVSPIDAGTITTTPNTDTTHHPITHESILHNFSAKRTTPIIIDTLFTFDNTSYRLRINYYCLLDSALIVPMQYVEDYGILEFITNNYAADIKLFKNNDDEILDTSITKNDFINILKVPDPIKYRLLFQPIVSITTDSVAVNFSLSVPLTDIGEEVAFPILKKTSPAK
jgi:hypothetical protein